MKATFREVDRVVLEAVADEYQSFEAIVSKLSKMCTQFGVTDVERALLNSVANNLVRAYLLHADPPYATEVRADSDNIRSYWFYITEQGREYLAGILRASCAIRARKGRR